ncbi:uncharacterized protein LOC126979511 isoform X3 [Leptidea sinapis]|uniref:uncharacterized protein LOC126979511 isoform X3 n=2 Tax=Leptidea sinapis TaxID=189913 RepID=UPI0021C3E503|nr:uncharacterized protein LOC126979511 isoform X3 [Leptidea sinapis]
MFSDNTLSDLSRFWELDTISSKHKLTPEEKRCEQIFADTTYRESDGRFVVTLPLKEPPTILGDSYNMARHRFISLERRLQKNPILQKLYFDFMREYIELGHMTEINSFDWNSTEPSYYLPHHGVMKESSSTTKLRVVFDASAVTTSGKSFNDIQMIGATLQDDLQSILLRFRQHRIAVSADIQQFYRQHLVTSPQRCLQQILWRESPRTPLKTYVLNTVTYGTASAPFLATRCLLQLAHDCNNKAIQFTIEHDFYVDDYLSGSSSVEEAIHQCREVIAVLQSAQYNLRKWHSNSVEVMQHFHGINCDTQGSVDLSYNFNEISKTLGLNWKLFNDTFSFTINLKHTDIISKRHILSTIAQIFDPLGLVAPCIVESKIIMQQLWLAKCTWDEPVSEDIQRSWESFQNTLPLLNNIEIPRWISCDSPIKLQLHVFTDASERAYGACVFVRSIHADGSVHVHLLSSKSKVAPIKPATMPRLELCAALMGARLHSKVLQSLTLKFNESVFWCDSTIVLGWLSMTPSNLKPFVRHRISEIQDIVGGDCWRYVPSAENPADLVSRGLSADKLAHSSLWWSGPQFLQQDQSIWPQFPRSHDKSTLPETVRIFHVNVDGENVISTLFNRCSNFNALQRIVAFMSRFLKNCKLQNQNRTFGPLTTCELNNSLNLILKICQQESFPEEYNLLTSGKLLPPKNKLLSLSPFLDDNKIIRVGGRLHSSFYDYNVKHPVLLCSSNRICNLIFQMFHHKLFHAGPQLLLASIRHHYWPIGGRNLARKTTHQCVKCSRIKANTIQPIMGNLPVQRLHLEFPFLDTGVDYAGPIMIADRKGRGCRLVKSFICVFVCLATRAVHLELVSDMTKEAFLAALNRFIARRGKPRHIFSDNGSTFVGAFNELAQLLAQDLDLNRIDPGITFSFIPAYTPHFGGLWESAVKSTKYHLKRILSLTYLTFEEMATCLIQIESILNSRPLTPISSDPSDLTPLTPAHFLIGRSLLTLPHPQVTRASVSSLQRFQRIEYLKQHFWNRFSNEYVLWLQEKSKWHRSTREELKEGALVVIKDMTSPPLMWLMGRVIRVLPGSDGVARVADIRTRKGVLRRAFKTICPLPLQ